MMGTVSFPRNQAARAPALKVNKCHADHFFLDPFSQNPVDNVKQEVTFKTIEVTKPKK
jgi:hypothetical protein